MGEIIFEAVGQDEGVSYFDLSKYPPRKKRVEARLTETGGPNGEFSITVGIVFPEDRTFAPRTQSTLILLVEERKTLDGWWYDYHARGRNWMEGEEIYQESIMMVILSIEREGFISAMLRNTFSDKR